MKRLAYILVLSSVVYGWASAQYPQLFKFGLRSDTIWALNKTRITVPDTTYFKYLPIGAVGTMAGRDSTSWKSSASGTFTRDSLVTRGGLQIGSISLNTASFTLYGSENISQGLNVGTVAITPVGGGIRLARSSTNEPFLELRNGTNAANQLAQIRGINGGGIHFTDGTGSTSWLDITSTGKVGIGYTSPSTTRFAVKNGLFANATEWYNSSGTLIAKLDSSGNRTGGTYNGFTLSSMSAADSNEIQSRFNTAGTLSNVPYLNQANVFHGGLQQMDSLSTVGRFTANGSDETNLGYQNVIYNFKNNGMIGGIFQGYGDTLYSAKPIVGTFSGGVHIGGKFNSITTLAGSTGIENLILSGDNNRIGNWTSSLTERNAIINSTISEIPLGYGNVIIGGASNSTSENVNTHYNFLMGYNLSQLYPGAFATWTMGALLTNNAQKSSFLFGLSDLQDTTAFATAFTIRNIPLIVASHGGNGSSDTTTINDSNNIYLSMAGAGDSSAYIATTRKDNYWKLGSSNFELSFVTGFDENRNTEFTYTSPTSQMMKFLKYTGGTQSLHFLAERYQSGLAWGNVYVDTGNFYVSHGFAGFDSLRGSAGTTTYWNKTGYHGGLGASYMGNLSIGTLTTNGNTISSGAITAPSITGSSSPFTINSTSTGYVGIPSPSGVVVAPLRFTPNSALGSSAQYAFGNKTTSGGNTNLFKIQSNQGTTNTWIDIASADSVGNWTMRGSLSIGANYGNATIGAGDSVQVSVTGLTTATGFAIGWYKMPGAACDTVASYKITSAGKLTIFGKFGWVVSWLVTHL